MLSRWQFNLLTALGAAALLLVLFNSVLFTLNRDAQGELNRQQQFIQQTVPLEGLYRDIVKALAETAVKGNDRQVLDMLAAQGLNVSVQKPAADARRIGAFQRREEEVTEPSRKRRRPRIHAIRGAGPKRPRKSAPAPSFRRFCSHSPSSCGSPSRPCNWCANSSS